MRKSFIGAVAAIMAGVVFAGAAFAGPVEEMLAVDTAFAEYAVENGEPAAFAQYAADNVMMFPGGDQPYSGRENLISRFADWPENATLRWTPETGMASDDGGFGFTWGRYVFTSVDDNGDETKSHGKYVSIWKKQTDGNWKFVADIGNGNPAPAE